jgi:hypothetical protein
MEMIRNNRILHDVIITNMSSDKAVVDSEPVAFTNEEAK